MNASFIYKQNKIQIVLNIYNHSIEIREESRHVLRQCNLRRSLIIPSNFETNNQV